MIEKRIPRDRSSWRVIERRRRGRGSSTIAEWVVGGEVQAEASGRSLGICSKVAKAISKLLPGRMQAREERAWGTISTDETRQILTT